MNYLTMKEAFLILSLVDAEYVEGSYYTTNDGDGNKTLWREGDPFAIACQISGEWRSLSGPTTI